MSKADSQWKKRVLCSDGNCIGIIGDDGRCKECGLVYDGELPTGADESDTDVDAVDASAVSQILSGDGEQADGDPQEDSDTPEDAWENRTLCIDESCIGVVGSDGRCKECGKPFNG